MKQLTTAMDAQGLAFVQGQAFKINSKVYETKYPDWDFARLVFVDTSGPEWSPGILTYTSDMTGVAKWQSGAAKDVPMADVSQDMVQKTFHLAAVGYQWNLEEVNTTLGIIGGSLPNRRARAARLAYMQFMYNLTVKGDPVKGLGGLINQGAAKLTVAPADGTGSVPFWVNEDGVGTKTPAQIVRDLNAAISGSYRASFETELADTVALPPEALEYLAATPYSETTMETILSFVQRTNLYTLKTGQQLTFVSWPELSTAATSAGFEGMGRMVVYKNDEDYVKLHLPMPHKFLPVYADGPFNFAVPGIFRTGGIELQTAVAFRYVDGISQPPAEEA
jgi:hypothetical protein